MNIKQSLIIIQGILFILVGSIFLIFPEQSLSTLSLIFQLILIVLGTSKLIKAYKERESYSPKYKFYLRIFEGVLLVIVTFIFYFNNNISILTFSLIFGTWCIYFSVSTLIGLINLRKIKFWYVGAVLSVMALAAGSLILFKYYFNIISLTNLISIFLISSGLQILFTKLYLDLDINNKKNHPDSNNDIKLLE